MNCFRGTGRLWSGSRDGFWNFSESSHLWTIWEFTPYLNHISVILAWFCSFEISVRVTSLDEFLDSFSRHSFVSWRTKSTLFLSTDKKLFPIYNTAMNDATVSAAARVVCSSLSHPCACSSSFSLLASVISCRGRLSWCRLFQYFSTKRGRIIELHARTVGVIAKMFSFRCEQWRRREIAASRGKLKRCCSFWSCSRWGWR